MESAATMALLLISLSIAAVASGQRFKVMTTTSSVAVTWNQSANFEVRIRAENDTVCKVTRGQHSRICLMVGLEPSTRHDVTVISEADDWTELYSGIHFTKPLPPRELRWVGSYRQSISVQWRYPLQEVGVDGYILLLRRTSNNMTEYQSALRTNEAVVRHEIWLPSTYGVAYGTTFTLTVWTKYRTERSAAVRITVWSAPRPVDRIQEDTVGRTNTSAAVWWEPPASGGVTGYRLVITSRTMAVGDFPIPGSKFDQQNITVENTTTSYTFHQLTPVSSYDVSIWAIYNGAEANVARHTTVYTNPSPVRQLLVSYATTDAVTISWLHDNLYLPVGFDYIITATSGDHRRSERTVSSAVSTQVRYLRPGHRYTLSIVVRLNTPPYSSSDAVTTQAQLKPDPVQYIQFSNITAGTVNVSWVPGRYQQDSYSIRYHGIYLKKYWSSAVTSEVPFVVLSAMFPGETYYVGVTALSGNEPSIEITKTVTIEPLPPESLHVDEAKVAERSALIEIRYNQSQSANTQWHIVYEVWSTGRRNYLTVPADVANLTLWRLTPGRMYTVRAYGMTTGGVKSSKSTEQVTFTTRPVFTSALTSHCTSRSVRVSYQYTSDTYDGYAFTLYPDVIKKFNLKYDEAEMTYHNLLPGTPYTVMVQVYWGDVLSLGENITVLTKPEASVKCGQVDNTSIELLMDDARGRVDQYLIECNPGCDYSGTKLPTANDGVTKYTVTGLNPDTSYQYTVRAVREVGMNREESRPRLIYCRTGANDNV